MTSHSAITDEESPHSIDAGPRTIQVVPFDGPGWVTAFVGWWAQVLQATVQDDLQHPEDIVGAIRPPRN